MRQRVTQRIGLMRPLAALACAVVVAASTALASSAGAASAGAASAEVASGRVGSAEVAAAATPVRIMPLGDSITGSPGCWRALLWNQLRAAGLTDIDFVGTQPPQGCGVSYDGDSEGHGGILATNMADQGQLPPWLAATRPDVVVMHLGTNDVWSNRSATTILAAFTTLVGQMRASNAAMRILVAQILPMNPSTCAECGARVVALDNAIPAWAAGLSTARSPITVVDQWTGFSTAADTSDGVHPVDSGNVKIANRWLAPLSAAVRSVGSDPAPGPSPSGPAPSPSGPAPSPSVPVPAGDCTATYRTTNQWQGGFQGEITVHNAGAAASRSWSVAFGFADGQTISQLWGGASTQDGARVRVDSLDYNGVIAANGSLTIGFIASWTSVNSAPTPTCTLG